MRGLLLIGILLLQPQPRLQVQPAGGVISGRVVYADGAPVSGSIVTVVPVSPPPSTPPPRIIFTNQAGEFRSSSLAPGRYYLRLGTTRDTPMFYPGVSSESAATAITVSAAANVENLNFALPATAAVRLTGHVSFPANQNTRPPDQRVQLTSNNAVASPIAADGTFDIAHVRPGRYSLTVSLAGLPAGYLSANGGRYGNIADLVNAGLLDATFNGVISGFRFSIVAAGPNYAAAAIPASQGNERYGYYSTPDGVIRYVTIESLAPGRQEGKPVQ